MPLPIIPIPINPIGDIELKGFGRNPKSVIAKIIAGQLVSVFAALLCRSFQKKGLF